MTKGIDHAKCVAPADDGGGSAPIFIVGLPRSGSTLWSRVLAAHKELAFFPEMHYLSIWNRDFRTVLRESGDLSKEENVKKLVKTMFEGKPEAGLKQGKWFWMHLRGAQEKGLDKKIQKRILNSPDKSLGSIFKIIIDESTATMGKKIAVVKFPVYPFYIGKLFRWYPNCKVVHISRDPRSIAASKSNDPGGIGILKEKHPWLGKILPVFGRYFAVAQYIFDSYTHSKYSEKDNYQLFLYENLVVNPKAVAQQLCSFCDLSFDESMLSPKAGQASSITGKRASGFDSTRSEGWKAVLSDKESAFITKLTRSSMKRFGYTPQDT